MFFTYAHNILLTKAPEMYYDNVQHTIAEYRQAWGEPEAPVRFLDDADCRAILQRVEPRLVPHFDTTRGMHKADICRVAALYEEGGYYFDVDIQVVKPLRLADGVGFATANEFAGGSGGFFQAFLAAAPGHPILKQALYKMLLYYEGKLKAHRKGANMGTSTLKDAFDAVPEAQRGEVRLLQEIYLSAGQYRKLPRHIETGACNFVVHDAGEHAVYFYSRIVGSPRCLARWGAAGRKCLKPC